jgi:lipopolysaccharide export system protein LptA
MSLEPKVNVVGSASIKRAVYYSDYDLFENVYGKSDRAEYNHFKNVFEIIKRSDNVVISDFKCGETNKL